uniref:Uncharacterized protein n=1 Tax=Arundo donax TaxID=35708 RepID=A0A0A9H9H6_ARUDO
MSNCKEYLFSSPVGKVSSFVCVINWFLD